MFFDIDGTLLTEDTHIIPESAKNAIQKARENGHLAFINTGRTIFNIEKEIHDVGFDGYVCGCGTYVKAGEKVIVTTTLEKDTCKNIIEHLRKHKVDAVLEGLEDVYFDKTMVYTNYMKRIQSEFYARGYGVDKHWDTEGVTYDKLFTVASDETNIDDFVLYFKEEFEYIDRGRRCGEIVPKGYSKASGIKQVLEHYNLDLDDAYVFGDSSNDLPMFEYVPNSIAMGKSDDCIVKVASFQTKDIHCDGIAYAMKHFNII
jgi:Cof subfamily protein (haloacid dehalogenase superfamily)